MATPSRSRIRSLPALILIVLLTVLTMRSWLQNGPAPLELDSPAKGLTGITWAGTVATSGRLAVAVTYQFSDTQSHEIDVRTPTGARYLSINGRAISADSGTYATVTVTGSGTVSYELPDAVTRYRDGALLRLAAIDSTSISGQEGLFPCASCYVDGINYGDAVVYGSLSISGADSSAAMLQFIGLQSIRTAGDAAAIRFVGIDHGANDVSMLATLPAGAASGLHVRDGSVAQALAAARAELQPSGDPVHMPQPAPRGQRWASIALTILLGLLIAWMFRRLVVNRAPAVADADPGKPHRNMSLLLLLPITVAMGVIALVGARDGVAFVWFVLIAGPIFAAVSIGADAPLARRPVVAVSTRR